MSEQNLLDAEVGQTWICPKGQKWNVVKIHDLNTSKLIEFEGVDNGIKELLIFSSAVDWTMLIDH